MDLLQFEKSLIIQKKITTNQKKNMKAKRVVTARSFASGFIKGVMAPVSAFSIGQSYQAPVVPVIRHNPGSFATDWQKIGGDFRKAMSHYELKKEARSK